MKRLEVPTMEIFHMTYDLITNENIEQELNLVIVGGKINKI